MPRKVKMDERKPKILVNISMIFILIQVVYFAIKIIKPTSGGEGLSPVYSVIFTIFAVSFSIIILFILIAVRTMMYVSRWPSMKQLFFYYFFVYLDGMCVFAALLPFLSVSHKSLIHSNAPNIIDLILGLTDIAILVYLLICIYAKSNQPIRNKKRTGRFWLVLMQYLT